jgi:hypothetical protein
LERIKKAADDFAFVSYNDSEMNFCHWSLKKKRPRRVEP